MADPQVNLFGPSTEDNIKVGYISTTRGYITGVGIKDANIYAKKDPGTKFILQNRDYIKYLNINEVNELTPEVLKATGEECKGVEWEAPIESPEVIFAGGGGVGVVGNPVFGTDNSLLAVDLVSGGFGYKYAPVTKLRDVSGKGAGAHLVSIVGEIADTEILYDKREDFEEYIIDDETGEEVSEIWYGPDGKEIGIWDPSLYLGEVGESFDTITDNYIKTLHEIATSGIGGGSVSSSGTSDTSGGASGTFGASATGGGASVAVGAGGGAATQGGIVLDASGSSGAWSNYTSAGDTRVAFDSGLAAGVMWWAAKPPGPKAVTSNGKTNRSIYKVEHVAWNEIPPPLDSEGKVADWSTNGWLNTHAISPIPPSHAKGSARGGELFTLEWDVDFPWDGEYSFKGCADNSAVVYVDNQELTRYELGSGGAAGKVLSLPTIVKKELTQGSHNIRIDLRNHEHIVQKKVQASSKTYGSLLLVEDLPQLDAGSQGGVTYDDLTCYAKIGRFFDINSNKAKYKVDPSLNQPEGSNLEVDFRVTTSSAFVNKIEVRDLFTEQGPELIKGEPTLPEISQIGESAKFISRGSGKDTKYFMTVTGNDLLEVQLEFRKHQDDSVRGGGHSVNAITIQTEKNPVTLNTGGIENDDAWPFDKSLITVAKGTFKNGKEYEITFSEARFQAPTPSNWGLIQFYGLNPANDPIEVRNNNKTLCLKDSHGSDCNAQFNIDSGDVTFAPDGRSLVGNRGFVTMTLSWNDDPNDAGKAVNQIRIRDTKWFQTNCIPTTGVTPDGYANTARGYVKFNDGFRVTGDYVTSFVSSWSTQTIKTGFTYQQVFDQIVSSYATILSRKPEADGFDYWVNSFKDNSSWTLSSLNAAISQDANNPTDGELLLHTTHNGVEGNYDECDENFFASNYGQSRTSGSQTQTFYFTTEVAPPPEITNNDERLAFYDEDVSEGASTSDPDLIGDVRAHFNILNITQLSESVPSLPGQMELKQLQKNFKKTVVVGKVYPVTVTNAGQGFMGNTPAPLAALQVRDIVNQDTQNTNNTETSVERTKVFNTVDYQTSANRRLWRTNVNMRGGFMNDYGVCPFDTKDTLPDNPYAGTHTIRWNNINFPISGNYTIRIGVDDNVDLKIGTVKGGNVLTISKEGYIISEKYGIKSTGVGTYVRYIEAGRYTIEADLTQIPGGKFGFGKIRKDGAIHDYSGYGLNPMALAITITTTVADVEEVVQRSWHANPMGVALNIKAPLPPAPVQAVPKQEGRCPANPIWSTRFPNAKDGTWYPVRFDSWTKFHNKYGMSPVPPLPTGGTDNGGIPFINRWDVQIPYDGWYKLRAKIDDIGTISIDGDVKLDLNNRNVVERGESLFYLSQGLKEVKVEIENNASKVSKWIDQKIFNTRDWVDVDPPKGGGIEEVNFKVSSASAFQNSINIKGLLFEQGPIWESTTSTKTNLIPGPTTPAAVEFIKRGSKYFLKASGNKTVQVKFDFRCVAPIFKGGAVIPACVPSTGITPAGYGNTIKGYLLYHDGFTSDGDFVTSYVSTWLDQQISKDAPLCVPSSGVTPEGYANTIKGYLLYNDGFKTEGDYVTSYNSTWLDQKIRGQYTYKMVFEQITESYETILGRRPEADGFDYWVNSFRDNMWTLMALNTSIKVSAEGLTTITPLGFVTQGELGFNATHDGLKGNYDECDKNFLAFNYGQPPASIVYSYQQVFEQITSSYATILSRRPEAEGFDYWVNSFKDNASWTLEDLNTAISTDANKSPGGEFLLNASHNGLEGNYDECNDNFFAFDYGQEPITNIPEPAAIQSVTIQTKDGPLTFDNLLETKALPDWPYQGSTVDKDAVFENGKEYEVTFSGLLSRARSTPPIKYIGLKTPGDKKYINSKKLVFDDNSPNGFDVNATFTIDSGDVTFSSDGNSLVGSKSGNVTMTYSWNDHPNIAGVALDEIKIGKTTWKQSGANGKVTRTFNYIANPNPTPLPQITSGGANDNSDTNEPNHRICFYDTDTSAGATAGPDLIGDVRAHFSVINVIQVDLPDTIEEEVEFDDKKLVQINNTIIKDVVVGQVYDVEIANVGQGEMGNTPAPLAHLKAQGGVLMAEDIPNTDAGAQGGVTHDDLVCSASKGRFYDIQSNKCKYVIDPPSTGTTTRYGITYDGPSLSTYGSYDGFGPLITPSWTSAEEYIKTHNGTTWVMKFSGVDFPERDDYYIKAIADDIVTVKIGGEEILKSEVGKGVQGKTVNISKGKLDLELVLFNRDIGRSYYDGNPVVAGVSITRKVDILAGTPEASKSWMENPISISAELIPPPCPRKVRGGGVVTEVEVIDPGNGYPTDPPTGTGYPAIVELDEIIVDDPGINYDCSKDTVVCNPDNGVQASLECDNFGRIKKVNLDDPGSGFTTWPDITIDSPTGVSATLRPKFKVTRELPPAVMIDEGLDPDKLIQVTDLVGLKQTGYYDGKPYYGAVFYKDGVRYAGYYETTGVLVQIYDTMQESIDGMVTTPPSAIQRQGTDIASDDPNLDIPNTPDTLI